LRALLAVALSVLLVSCAAEVKLLTLSGLAGISAGNTGIVSGLLVPDEDAGTALRVERSGFTYWGIGPDGALIVGDIESDLRPEDDGRVVPVTWPEGSTGRRVWSDVEVLNADGEVVARTGSRYVCAALLDGSWSACSAIE
jgi:hypothetical protein